MKHPFFRTLLTEDADDQVWCPLRIAFWIAFIIFIALMIFAVVWRGAPFDPVAYSAGAGGLLVATGGAIFFNGRSDPPKEKS